ncbi:MAG: hypothetical protein QXO86_02635 [Nitrososphaerota archaeon]
MIRTFEGPGQLGAITKLKPMPFNPITQLKCQSCGSIHTRPHKEGDYIFGGVEEKCPNCGGSKHTIIAIYVEDQRQPPRKQT